MFPVWGCEYQDMNHRHSLPNHSTHSPHHHHHLPLHLLPHDHGYTTYNIGRGICDAGMHAMCPLIPKDPWLGSAHAAIHPHYPPSPKPLRAQSAKECSGGTSEIVVFKDRFEVKLDVQNFAPSEVKVKTMPPYLIVEGEHEEKEDDHGFVSRRFKRKYILPPHVRIGDIKCNFGEKDGLLHVIIPRDIPPEVEAGNETVHEIQVQ